jgi:hypothetical protein
MLWHRKQTLKRAVAKARALVLSPAEKPDAPAEAAWPTGLAHLWLKRAPAVVPVAQRARPVRPRER